MNLIRKIFKAIKTRFFLIRYRLDPVGYARHLGVKAGSNCRFIGANFGSEPYLLTNIGIR